jgi:hypothetical protein
MQAEPNRASETQPNSLNNFIFPPINVYVGSMTRPVPGGFFDPHHETKNAAQWLQTEKRTALVLCMPREVFVNRKKNALRRARFLKVCSAYQIENVK